MMRRRMILSFLSTLLVISCSTNSVYAKGIKVENLPSIFDDGTHVPDRIEWKTWEQTTTIIPKGSIFEVVDFETGLYFKVQRRAGSRHADVQPMTSVDTAIMKEIYDGKWSWKRRAIYIRKGTHLIPASMHGMPHGAGALANDFPGHFCIHLPDSTTHRSNKEDPSHQLMILKAAGRLESAIDQATSDELAQFFILAINQEDDAIIKKLIKKPADVSVWKNVFFIQPTRSFSKEDPSTLLVNEYPVEITYGTERGLIKRKRLLRVVRETLTNRWYVSLSSILNK